MQGVVYHAKTAPGGILQPRKNAKVTKEVGSPLDRE
jgi:hypothetical protein